MIELNESNFIAEVIDRSQELPVLVDFWADWCAPCKMLTPVLEALDAEFQGQLQIGKVNTDEQRALAEANAIRSLPTLRLYRNGEVVEEVLGAQPESALRALIEPCLVRPSDGKLQQARQLADEGRHDDAILLLETLLADDTGNTEAAFLLARLCIINGQLDRAQPLLEGLPRETRESHEGTGLQHLLEFAHIAADSPPLTSLDELVAEYPDNADYQYQLAARQVIGEDYDAALETFMNLLKTQRGYKDSAARKGLLTLFALLGDDDPRVSQYRRRMASLLM